MTESGKIFDPTARILVLGDVMLDSYASGDVTRISPEAPVPILRRLDQYDVAGGGANVAANIAAFGGRPLLLSIVGPDEEAERLRAILGKSGVDVHFFTDSSRPTTHKLRILAGNHQMLRIDKESVSPAAGDIEDALISEALALLPAVQCVVLSDYLKGCLSDRVLRAVIDAAVERGIYVFVDPKRTDFSVYRGASYITPNRSELKAATGVDCHDRDSCREAAHKAIAATGAGILLTRSERGMVLFEPDGEEVWLPTEAREVYDVSGAGDSVIAAFSYGLGSELSRSQALRVANCAAGIVIGKAGTATATEAEVSDALEQEHFRRTAKRGVSSLEEAVAIRARWKRENLTVGFTNGCFDLLHSGHVSLLRESSQHCDRLIVALNTDASVRRLKGPSRPIQDQAARGEVMAAIRYVDLVVFFDEETPFELIEQLVPDVLVKGSDYTEDEIVGADIVKAAGGSVVRAELMPGRSTTNLIARSVQR